MNTILFDKSDYIADSNHIQFSDERFEHIRTILKKESTGSIKVAEREGKMGLAEIVSMDSKSIVLDPNCTENPPEPLPVTLIVALPRPQSMKKVLYTATVMGVKEIYFIKTWKVDKNYWSTPQLLEEKRDKVIVEALTQTCDTVAPTIHLRKKFKSFVLDELPELMKNRETRLFHPTVENVEYKISPNTEYLYIIGPEGGFNEYEVELLTEVGALPTSLGSRIQRVEQAVASVLGFTACSLL